ncbi:MAG TPA: GGDEF domain-containing protein [Anaeromyxobacteraceae bacterium]|nr:GGDEF domain-containing protein [Anaeromyxobacteraceae bacterium]
MARPPGEPRGGAPRPTVPRVELDATWTAVPRLPAPSKEHAFLLVLSGPQLGAIYPLEPGRELIIGRRDDADILISDDGVSRRQASLLVDGDHAVIRDLGSANGTFVDGARVLEALLGNGSRVHIGMQTVLKFIWADDLEAEYQRKLVEGALQDPLTGLYNRRMLDERLEVELAAAKRHDRLVALLMVDVDRFKAINDAHGHLAGDEVLRMVARTLRATVRQEDLVARFGGEEFVVVAPETGLDGARQLGERVRHAVERSRCVWQDRELSVTVSVGATVSAPPAELVPGEAATALLDAADRALYRAKQDGRNRVAAAAMGALPPR